jgi:hypothetical protein
MMFGLFWSLPGNEVDDDREGSWGRYPVGPTFLCC